MTETKGFEVLRRGGNPGKPIRKRTRANDVLIDRVLASKGPSKGFEYKRRGSATWRKASTLKEYREAIAGMRLKTGDAIYTRRTAARSTFVLRAVVVIEKVKVPTIPDSSATPGVKAIWTAIFEEIPNVERDLGYDVSFVYQGIYNCRRIYGSSTWSQHAFRNGLDWHLNRTQFGALDGVAMDKLVARLRNRGVAAELLWRVSGHYGHVHGTGAPKRSGWPPCA